MAKITIIIEDFEFPQVKGDTPEPVLYTEDCQPKHLELVLVRDHGDESWGAARFLKYEHGTSYPWHTVGCCAWAQCAKYDERLLS